MKNSEQISAFYALLVAGLFAFLSFYDTDAENYLFPRILAVVLAALSVILFITNTAGGDDSHDRDSAPSYFSAVWPGLLIGFIFLMVMEYLGFYTSSFFAFLAILIIYDNQPTANMKLFVTKAAISAVFMLVLYLLFWNGLHVRTPTGILF
ncbi:MAG: tripartite tricarboxylate transporter TctB family protein [Gammaproteobacteria bacterium]|nr:tripartite tricarboxylate transporter TctB family protein [Gammaproteobacteria bacterium]